MLQLGLGYGLVNATTPLAQPSGPLPLQIVGSRGELHTLQGGATTTSNVKQNGRHRFYIGNADVSELSVAYAGWWVDPVLGEQPVDKSYRVSATLEIAGVVKRFTFSASPNGIVAAGSDFLASDPLYPAEFGLDSFAAGTELWIKSERQVSLGSKFAFHQTPSYSVPITGETYYVGPSTAATQLDNPGPLVGNTDWAIQAHVWLPLCLLGRPLTKMMATAVYGDSVANGDGGGSGDGLGATGGGFLRRGLINIAGVKTARVHLARSSETAKSLNTSNAHRFAMLQYVNHVKLISGGNDYSQGELVDNTITRLANIRAQIKALNPGAHLEEYELWVKTNSTDNWATIANQTPRPNYETGGSWRDVANTALAAAVGTSNLDNFVQMPAGVLTDTVALDKWKAPPAATADGTHPNASTYQDMTNANAANLAAQRLAYEGH